MSFSTKTKDELLKLRHGDRQSRASLLCGITHTAGALTLSREHGLGIQYSTENHSLGKYIASLITGLYDVEASIAVREQERLSARTTVVRIFGNDVRRLLSDMGVLDNKGEGVDYGAGAPAVMVRGDSRQRMFLRGAFLGAGSVSDPGRAYHLEIVCRTQAVADDIETIIRDFSINAKQVSRKGSFVVYLKESESIVDFLTLIGASGSTLEFENVRVVKNVRNYINRTSNCETANLQKTVRASVEQADSIRYLMDNCGLDGLAQPLREIAELRLNHPDATLSELADIAGIGRSAVNHRLTKLVRLAHDLQIKKGEG